MHVDLANKPSWYRRVNPRGLVPALALDTETVLVESADICTTLAQQRMRPGSSFDVDRIVSVGLRCLAGSGRSWGISSPPAPRDVAALEAALADLDARLAHRFLGGDDIAVDDIAVDDILLYPFARRFSVGLPRFSEVEMTKGRPNLARWMTAMAQRPSVQLASADDGLLQQAYGRHRCLDFFDYDSYAAAALHPALARYVVVAE